MGRRGHFYYSEAQYQQHKQIHFSGPLWEAYALLDTGETVLYSEMQSEGNDSGSNWPDAVYLGEGVFSHNVKIADLPEMDPYEHCIKLMEHLKDKVEFPDFIFED